MTEHHEVPVMFLGLGNVGGALLRQVLETRDVLVSRAGLRLVPIAVADVSGVLLDPAGLPDEALRSALNATSEGGLLRTVPGIRPLDDFTEAIDTGAILTDLTATPATESTLRLALDAGCGIVLANKIPLAKNWVESRAFFNRRLVRYEVTVGAGIPVIETLLYLLGTGDQVTSIEGCLSGTLGYLCAELETGTSFSAAVARARQLGYTEPNPREDLSGRDVARKALILARTAGWALEMSSLTVEALYPESMIDLETEDFLAATPSLDAVYETRVREAQREAMVLRYVARISPEEGTVGLVAVPRDGPLGALRGPANYIALRTRRYRDVPLVLSGPGAGPEVTAAGVLGDIIGLASRADFRAT